MKIFLSALVLLVIRATVLPGVSQGEILNGTSESPFLNIIDDPDNASNGLGFFDLSLSFDLNRDQAISVAREIVPTARFATPNEFDNLFLAAGVTPEFLAGLVPSQGFDVGGDELLFINNDSNLNALVSVFAETLDGQGFVSIFTDPDGDVTPTTTRDFVGIDSSAFVFGQSTFLSANRSGFLIAVDPVVSVPEPTSLIFLLSLGLVGLTVRRRIQ